MEFTMAEAPSVIKGTTRKLKRDVPTSRSFLHCANTSLGSGNGGRLSLLTNGRLQKITSGSLERLNSFSQNAENSDWENYQFQYSTYLLRKTQKLVLKKNREEKEERVKKCFVSLKLELQNLLEKYLQMIKELCYLKVFLEVVKEINEKLEEGRKILKILQQNEFDVLLKSLSSSLEQTVNQLQLVDIDKSIIDNLFIKGVWGSGSQIEECLKKIDSSTQKNQDDVSKVAAELIEIKALVAENTSLRERFQTVFQEISDEILETNYKVFTSIVKSAFNQREEYKDKDLPLSLECDTDIQTAINTKLQNTHFSFRLSQIESSYPAMPNSSSTPQQK